MTREIMKSQLAEIERRKKKSAEEKRLSKNKSTLAYYYMNREKCLARMKEYRVANPIKASKCKGCKFYEFVHSKFSSNFHKCSIHNVVGLEERRALCDGKDFSPR